VPREGPPANWNGDRPLKDTTQRSIRFRRIRIGHKSALVVLVLGVLGWFWPVRRAQGDNFVFYLPSARQLVPIQVLDNTRYLPLVKVLSLVGTVSSLGEKRESLKLGVGEDRLELHAGNRKVKLNKHDIQLSSPVRVVGGEWFVPLDFLYSVLPHLTSETIRYREGDERMFLGNVNPLTFSARLSPLANGDRLALQFTAPVTVQTASTNGQWVIFLGDKALMPLEPEMKFQSHYISSMRFDDQDGVPKLIIAPTGAMLNLYPSVSDGGKTLQLDVTQPAAPATQATTGTPKPSPAGTAASRAPLALAPTPAGGGQPAAASNAAPISAAAPTAALSAPPLPVVVLDAGHGGADAGGHSLDGVTERDLVAALAERTQAALTSTGKVRVVLTRTGPSDPTVDERDAVANLAHPVAFLTLHAGDLGGSSPAIALYTYQAPSAPLPLRTPNAFFVPWGEAQQGHLTRSRDFAGLLAQQFGELQNVEVRGPMAVPVRQLRSVDAPAVALELGTLGPRQDAASLNAAPFQDQVANAVARAVLALARGTS
jgi:N-acetylmuramoyl-L-alanine amidase